MLFGDVVFAIDVALKGGEDARPGEERVAAIDLELKESFIRESLFVRSGSVVVGALRGDRKVLQFFAQDDNRLFVKEGILEIRLIRGKGVGDVATGSFRWSVKGAARGREESEYEIQALGVKLWDESVVVAVDGGIRTST